MKVDRTLIVGGFGLAAIIAALGMRADRVSLASPDGLAHVSVPNAETCPDSPKAIPASSEKPIGSLSLVM
jgi:hypothetical protein